MNPSRIFLVLALSLLALSGCGKNDKSATAPKTQSAAEIFALRSQCAQLGDSLLAEGVHGPDVRAEQKSKYSPGNNRCYVELDFSPADAGAPDYQSTRYLYDGQTKQVLAWVRMERDGNGAEKTGCTINDSADLWVPDSTACDLVSTKITDVMADDRKQ
jgi:hypothetical protein